MLFAKLLQIGMIMLRLMILSSWILQKDRKWLWLKNSDANEKILQKRRALIPQKEAVSYATGLNTLMMNLRNIDSRLEDLLLRVPNIPQDSVPIGDSEDDNIVISTCGEMRKFDFLPAPHWELGERLGIIDFERGVRLSGTRFYVLKGLGSRLQRSLINFMLNLHTEEHGYQEAYLPYMVKKECLIGSSNLPKFADNLYRDIEEDLWLVPTAEVPLTNMHRDEILPATDLPINYVAYTACFRREKMSAGKDTRGIKRGHQFDKVEMYKFTEPQNSNEELEYMVDNAVDICRKLEIPYRIKKLCTADISFASTKTYDIEMWGARLRRMAGSKLMFQLRRFSSQTRKYSLPSDFRQQTAICTYFERLGIGTTQSCNSSIGKLSAVRRQYCRT